MDKSGSKLGEQTKELEELKFHELRKYSIEGFNSKNDSFVGINSIAVANRHRCVIVACNVEKTLKAVNIDTLFNSQNSQHPHKSKSHLEAFKLDKFDFICKLNFNPSLVNISNHGYGSILLCAGQSEANFPVIELFNLDDETPTESFAKISIPEIIGVKILDVSWHPIYFDNIVAICTSDGKLMILAIDEARKRSNFVYRNSSYKAKSCCWSPKGRQLVVGRQDGKIIRFQYEILPDLNEFRLKQIDRSLQIPLPEYSIVENYNISKIRWISRETLLIVHSKLILESDKKRKTIFSVFSLRDLSKALYSWQNVIEETNSNLLIDDHQVHLLGLNNALICGSSESSEMIFLSRQDDIENETIDHEMKTADPVWRAKKISLSSLRTKIMNASTQNISRINSPGTSASNASNGTPVNNLNENLCGLAIAYGVGIIDCPVMFYITICGKLVACYAKADDNFSLAIPYVREEKECPFNDKFFQDLPNTDMQTEETVDAEKIVDDELESSMDYNSESSSDTGDYCESDEFDEVNSDQSLGGFEEECDGDFMVEASTDESEEDEMSIQARFRDVEVEKADFKTIWTRLTDEERNEFKDLIKSGDIYKYVPDCDSE